MTELTILCVYVVLCVVVGIVAGQKGRSVIGFMLLAALLSPIVGLIAILAMPPDQQAIDRQAQWTGKSKKCPACAELVKPDAQCCRFCGHSFAAAPRATLGDALRPPRPAPPPKAFIKLDPR